MKKFEEVLKDLELMKKELEEVLECLELKQKELKKKTKKEIKK